MSLIRKVSQDVQVSTSNNSTSPLNAGSTFTGTGESTLDCVGIQINFKADQNASILIEQSIDNTNWDIIDTYTYYYSKGGWSQTIQATASYFRVLVTNTSATNMTYLRLQSVLCPFVEAVPRSLCECGGLKTSVGRISSEHMSMQTLVTPMNAVKVSEAVRLVGTLFAGASGSTIDGNFWTTSAVSAGSSVTNTGGQVALNTGATTADANTSIVSTRTARYVSANTNYFRGIIRCPAVTTTGAGKTNTRTWGAYTATDGFFFKQVSVNDAETFSIVTRKASSDTAVASGSFNGNLGGTYILDENVHTYEIYWSNTRTWFLIDGILLHTVTGSTAPNSDTLHLPVYLQNNNSGTNQTSCILEVRVASISRLGQIETAPIWKYYAGALAATVLKYGPGRLHSVANNSGAGTACTLYDSTNTGAPTNPICIIDLSKNVGNVAFDIDFYTGLVAVITGASANTTIIYE